MYVLDTQALADFVQGDENTARQFLRNAERQNQQVYVSIISFGALKAGIDSIADSAKRDTWVQRFNIAIDQFRPMLFNVEERTSLEWAILKNMDIRTASGEELGDDERLILATAIIESKALVTSTPEIYNSVADRRGLRMREI